MPQYISNAEPVRGMAPTNQPTNQSTNQPTNQPINQSINQLQLPLTQKIYHN
jgi:hypothetical protein